MFDVVVVHYGADDNVVGLSYIVIYVIVAVNVVVRCVLYGVVWCGFDVCCDCVGCLLLC